MTAQRTPFPSPLVGEGGRERSERTGEGVSSHDFIEVAPSPASRLRRSAPSPARGEGTEPVAPRRTSPLPVRRARRLRVNMTDAERKLWFALRDRRFINFKFRRQVPVGPFIADFLCYDARLVIEVDGGQHAESRRDARRDAWLAANHFHVLRFWNNDVLTNLEGVLTVILESLSASKQRLARFSRELAR